MKETGMLAVAFLATLMLVSMYPLINPATSTNGPRADLDIIWYESADAAFAALVDGEVDMIQLSLTREQKEAAEANPEIQIASYVENGMTEFDLNNNLTIMDYPTSTNPMHIEKCRQAIAFLIDKDYIVSNILDGSRIDAPVCYPQIEDWVDMNYVTYDQNHNGIIEPAEDNYPFPYDPDVAAALLASCSFGDTDGNGYLNYPNDPVVWGDAAGIDTTLMPLKICIRSDHAHRREAGRYLYRQLEGDPAVPDDSILALSPAWAAHGKVGGDWDTTDEMWVQPISILRPIVMRDRNYHIYTGGWSFGRFPTYLFFLFHSMFWYPYGPNYVTDHAHPYEDMILEELYYAPNLAHAQNASKWYTGEHVIHCKNIPLWSYTSYAAWRKELVGVINMKGYGIVNDYTFLNAYKVDGTPIRMGLPYAPSALNVMYSGFSVDWACLDRIYSRLLSVNPYDLSIDQPWVAQHWEVGEWFDDISGEYKTTITYWIRQDVYYYSWHEMSHYTAWDVEFSIWYYYTYSDSWHYGDVMDIHHTEVIDDYTIEVYFDIKSIWAVYSIGDLPLLVRSVFYPHERVLDASETSPLLGNQCYENFTGDGVTTTFTLLERSLPYKSYVTVNFTHMIESSDYYFDYRDGQTLIFYDAPPSGTTIEVWYHSPKDIHGYYPGDMRPEEILIGCGMFTATEIVEGTGGRMSCERNPYFFLETPLLGEIDWRWYWIGTTKPRSGNFKIDILDVVKCCIAYSSRGDGAYSPVYLPSADIDSSDLCHIGILDIVTITVKYAQEHGAPQQQEKRTYPVGDWKYLSSKPENPDKKDYVNIDGKKGWLVWESKKDSSGHTLQVWLIDPDGSWNGGQGAFNCDEFFAARYCDTYWIAKCPYDKAFLDGEELEYEDVNGDGKFTEGVDRFTKYKWVSRDNDDQDGDTYRDKSVYEYDIQNKKLKYEVHESKNGKHDNTWEKEYDPPEKIDDIPFSNGTHE